MNVLAFCFLVVAGFTACAEFGSYAFVHPVVRRLPQQQHIEVEQGLLRTFGRVMPVLMPLCVVLSLAYALGAPTIGRGEFYVRWASAAAFILVLIPTLLINVPINVATGRWDARSPPSDWQATRDKWERAQAVRSWLLLIGFVLACLAVSLRIETD
jgi:hypothetical protein